MSHPNIDFTTSKLHVLLRFVFPVTNFQYKSAPTRISTFVSPWLLSASCYCFANLWFWITQDKFWPWILGHIFGTPSTLIRPVYLPSIGVIFNSYSFNDISPSLLLKNPLIPILTERTRFKSKVLIISLLQMFAVIQDLTTILHHNVYHTYYPKLTHLLFEVTLSYYF